MELDGFIAEAKDELKSNLIAIVLYGSRYWGYFNESSDYDVFVMLGKRDAVSMSIRKKLQTKYPKVSIMYFIDKNDILEKSKTGSWAAYAILLKGSRQLYKTEEYEKLLGELSEIKPNKKMIALDYINNKNELEYKELVARGGFDANKWAFLSIWKRMQIVDYFQKNVVNINFEDNIKNSLAYLKDEEVAFVKLLKDRTYKRSSNWSEKDREVSVAIMEKMNKLIDVERE